MGHIEIMKVCLDHSGQMDADISELNDEVSNAVMFCADLTDNIPTIFSFLGSTPLILASFHCHLEMVEYLVSRTDLISVKEKADAFELLGASLFDDMEDIVSVIQYWKSAMSHRYVDGVLTYPKSELNLEGPAHEEFREVTTLEQLEALDTDFESVQRQSLLVKERVLGPDHFNTLLYIRDAGLDYENDGAFKQCINLWVHAIEVQYFRLKPLNHARLYHFRSFLGLFSSLTDAEHVSNWNCQPKDFFDDIMCVFEKGARELNLVVSELDQSDISVKLNGSHLNECVAIIMHLLVSLTMLQPQLSSSQIHTFRSALYQLLKKDQRNAAGWSLLHIACSRSFKLMDGFSVPVSSTPRKTVIDLLLDTGADPCATDKEGNTPLHTLAKNEDCSKGMVESLLRAGAHLDAMNSRSFVIIMKMRMGLFRKGSFLTERKILEYAFAECVGESSTLRPQRMVTQGIIQTLGPIQGRDPGQTMLEMVEMGGPAAEKNSGRPALGGRARLRRSKEEEEEETKEDCTTPISTDNNQLPTTSAPNTASSTEFPALPKFKAVVIEGQTSYAAVRALEKKYPAANLTARTKFKGGVHNYSQGPESC
ncbi:protein fem-1 homolog A-like [Macrobrachium nipponense]|uniref:protein fem-1 homolog A-like n=1 Tax=Macrobrachium nipponense TaxID=159736 RepID=UPI0030C8ABFC